MPFTRNKSVGYQKTDAFADTIGQIFNDYEAVL